MLRMDDIQAAGLNDILSSFGRKKTSPASGRTLAGRKVVPLNGRGGINPRSRRRWHRIRRTRRRSRPLRTS